MYAERLQWVVRVLQIPLHALIYASVPGVPVVFKVAHVTAAKMTCQVKRIGNGKHKHSIKKTNKLTFHRFLICGADVLLK